MLLLHIVMGNLHNKWNSDPAITFHAMLIRYLIPYLFLLKCLKTMPFVSVEYLLFNGRCINEFRVWMRQR